MKLYIAGKVAKDSSFGGQWWRQDLCKELARLSGSDITLLDPVSTELGLTEPHDIFAKDCKLINQADAFLVFLSDDISVGGSQEILIARYFHKPVIGLAPKGGKFNGRPYQMPGYVIENYKDPFVYSTCDVVCETLEEAGLSLKTVSTIKSSGLDIIDRALATALPNKNNLVQ